MSRAVADASFCAAWVLPNEASSRAEHFLGSVLSGDINFIIPVLWYYEMGNLLRSAVLRGRMKKADASTALHLLAEVPVADCDSPTQESMADTADLAFKHKLSFYDASYLELASRLQIELHSEDVNMNRVAKKLGLLP